MKQAVTSSPAMEKKQTGPQCEDQDWREPINVNNNNNAESTCPSSSSQSQSSLSCALTSCVQHSRPGSPLHAPLPRPCQKPPWAGRPSTSRFPSFLQVLRESLSGITLLSQSQQSRPARPASALAASSLRWGARGGQVYRHVCVQCPGHRPHSSARTNASEAAWAALSATLGKLVVGDDPHPSVSSRAARQALMNSRLCSPASLWLCPPREALTVGDQHLVPVTFPYLTLLIRVFFFFSTKCLHRTDFFGPCQDLENVPNYDASDL